ncbi:MAG: hypothetical protein CMP21_05380 [Rickettsiales bacterium]|nr:hypothetical protein [Rickettsiales bacterium]|tara:strand:- start:1356 stop:2249 length:894 start_codon:yes stop_codon:yes gene_type:complete
MSTNRIFILVWILCLWTVSISASTGTYAMSFLELINNPYTASLSNTVTASDDSNALFINPASLTMNSSRKISAQLFKYIEDVEYKQFEMIQPYFDGDIAISYTLLTYGAYQQTTWTDKAGNSSSVDNKASLLLIAYAKQILNSNVGISAKYVEEVLASYKAKTIAMDFGVQKKLKENISVGMSLSNINLRKVKFLNDQANLRKIVRIGIQYSPELLKNKLIVLTDYVYLEHKSAMSYASIIKLHEKLNIRLGSNQLSDLFNISLGVGVNLGAFDLDVSYKNIDDFSDIYRVQMGVRF